jgi:hypothetical protein
MLRRVLFETRTGAWLLAVFERATGLALVDANWLGHQPSGTPQNVGGE